MVNTDYQVFKMVLVAVELLSVYALTGAMLKPPGPWKQLAFAKVSSVKRSCSSAPCPQMLQ